MGALIFDFHQEMHWVLLAIMGAFTLVGVYAVVMWIRFLVRLIRGEAEEYPIIGRILYATVPLIIGAVLIFFCSQNVWRIGGFYMDWFWGNYSQVSGPVEQVTITEGDYRDETIMDVAFTVDGEAFSYPLTAEQASYFEEGREMTIQYGWAGDELLIYRIFAVK